MSSYATDRGHDRSSHRRTSLSGSPEPDWRGSSKYDGREDRHEDSRKRYRSRSRDRPRKRRSLSPLKDSIHRTEDKGRRGSHEGEDRSRSERRHKDRLAEDYDGHKDRRRRHHREDEDKGQKRHHHRRRSTSHSGRPKHSPSPEPYKRASRPLPSQQDAFDTEHAVIKPDAVPEKQKPNFGTTGRLAAASNTVQVSSSKSIVLKYHEPPESRKPPASAKWRMYVFKDSNIIDTIELAEQSCWLFGREQAVVDIMLEHPSCSKQHAVVQFRYIEKRSEFGDRIGKVRPYLIDLESANGCSVNEADVPKGRYVELRDKDVVKFGHSSREYVLQLPPSG